MPIVTDFQFQHMHPGGLPHGKDVVDFLGPLRAFVGGARLGFPSHLGRQRLQHDLAT